MRIPKRPLVRKSKFAICYHGCMDGTTTAAPGPDHPQLKRVCRDCNAEKIVTPESWPYRKGREGIYQAHGTRCLDCERKRKAAYEQRRDKIALMVKAPTLTDEDKGDGKTKTKRERLDITSALKAGAHVLNEYAPSALARLVEYMEDPDSPHHQWALEHFLQRIQPRKLMEELGGQAAGVGALQDKRPMFVLNVTTAAPQQKGQVYENGELPVAALQSPEEYEAG